MRAIAHDLLASLDGPPEADAQQAWEVEILKRLDELAAGKARAIGVDEALLGNDDICREGAAWEVSDSRRGSCRVLSS